MIQIVLPAIIEIIKAKRVYSYVQTICKHVTGHLFPGSTESFKQFTDARQNSKFILPRTNYGRDKDPVYRDMLGTLDEDQSIKNMK